MITFECSRPFQWRPSRQRGNYFSRVHWAWFTVTRVPDSLDEFIQCMAESGIRIYLDNQMIAARQQTKH